MHQRREGRRKIPAGCVSGSSYNAASGRWSPPAESRNIAWNVGLPRRLLPSDAFLFCSTVSHPLCAISANLMLQITATNNKTSFYSPMTRRTLVNALREKT